MFMRIDIVAMETILEGSAFHPVSQVLNAILGTVYPV
jgi:hypothetical protein